MDDLPPFLFLGILFLRFRQEVEILMLFSTWEKSALVEWCNEKSDL